MTNKLQAIAYLFDSPFCFQVIFKQKLVSMTRVKPKISLILSDTKLICAYNISILIYKYGFISIYDITV